VVYGAGEFTRLDEGGPPPAMTDWSPVRRFGGYAAWGDKEGAPMQLALQRRNAAAACGCERRCNVHGHDHAGSAARNAPVSDVKGFWGAFGCSCRAV